MQQREQVILKRDCQAVLIPVGDKVGLPAGEPVTIVQSLGGSFTISARGYMLRIDPQDADALGKESAPRPLQQQTTPTQEGMDEHLIWEQLKTCYDPEIPVNIVDLGLVYDLQMTPLPERGSKVEIKMTLTAPGCGMGPVLVQDVEQKLLQVPGVAEAHVYLVWEPQWNRDMMTEDAKLTLGLL